MRKFLFWLLALVITVSVLVYQRMTGPTYPIQGKVNLDNTEISYQLERSHVNTQDYEIKIPAPEPDIQGTLHYRIFRSENEWTQQELTREKGFLVGSLPKQPEAGKLEYQVILKSQNQSVSLSGDTPVVIRFKGPVPAPVVILHILTIFGAFLLSTRAGLEALVPGSNPKTMGLWAAVFLFVGGMIFGPIMQKFSFGAFWTGFPVGKDLTDTKTLVALVFWVTALWVSRKKSQKTTRRWIFAASCVMLAVFLIPHSLLGSEFDYSQLKNIENPMVQSLDSRITAVPVLLTSHRTI
ncbi:MAG: hypothetical protein GF421_10210 [Candidatus Aminicenantes bacterium]|nr:hypothetical protein [Candidatus Aminicenantes bacterium]